MKHDQENNEEKNQHIKNESKFTYKPAKNELLLTLNQLLQDQAAVSHLLRYNVLGYCQRVYHRKYQEN
jgi:hypothetical protein